MEGLGGQDCVQLRRALEVANAELIAAHAAQQSRIAALEAEVCVSAGKRVGASVRVSVCVRMWGLCTCECAPRSNGRCAP